jgi:hypothetical protein
MKIKELSESDTAESDDDVRRLDPSTGIDATDAAMYDAPRQHASA